MADSTATLIYSPAWDTESSSKIVTNLGPLTAWTPPVDCAQGYSSFISSSTGRGYDIRWADYWHGCGPDRTTCCPSNWQDNAFYSPGVLPVGYYEISDFMTLMKGSKRAKVACPSFIRPAGQIETTLSLRQTTDVRFEGEEPWYAACLEYQDYESSYYTSLRGTVRLDYVDRAYARPIMFFEGDDKESSADVLTEDSKSGETTNPPQTGASSTGIVSTSADGVPTQTTGQNTSKTSERPVETRAGGGTITEGQDPNNETARSPQTGLSKGTIIGMAVGISMAMLLLVLGFLLFRAWKKRGSKRSERNAAFSSLDDAEKATKRSSGVHESGSSATSQIASLENNSGDGDPDGADTQGKDTLLHHNEEKIVSSKLNIQTTATPGYTETEVSIRREANNTMEIDAPMRRRYGGM